MNYLLFISTLAALATAADEPYPKASGVTSLSKSAFDKKFSSAKDVAFIQFYQPKSPSFKKSQKDWSAVGTELAGLAHFFAIDCVANAETCKEAKVTSFPAYKLNVKGEQKDYKGPIEHKKISEFLRGTLPPVTALKKSDKKWLKANVELPKAFLFTKTDQTPTFFLSAAAQLNGRMAFAEVSNTERKIVRQFKVEKYPALFVVPASVSAGDDDDDDDGDDLNIIPYTGKLVPASVMSFLQTHAKEGDEEEEEEAPISIEQLSDDTCVHALCNGLCAVAVLSVDPSVKSSKKAFREAISTLEQLKAERKDNAINFLWVDAVAEMEFLDRAFAITPQDYPQLVVLSGKRLRFAPFVGAYSKEGLASFLADIQSNKISTQPMGVSKMPSMAAKTTRCAVAAKAKPSTSTSSTPKPENKPRGYRGSEVLIELRDSNYSTAFTPSNSPWVVALVDESTPSEFLTELEAASKQAKHMIRFGVVRVGPLTEELSRLLQGDATRPLPHIRLFPAGAKSPDINDAYDGELTAEAISSRALSLLEPGVALVRVIDSEVPQSFSSWWAGSPLQPRLLLFTDKTEVPNLIRALALEYQDELPFGVAINGATQLSKQFNVTSFPQLAMLQGVASGKPDAKGQTQVKIQHQLIPKNNLNTIKLVRVLDDVARQWTVIKKQLEAAGASEDLKSEL